MITLKVPEDSMLTALYCLNDTFDNCFNDRFKVKILQVKLQFKKCMARSEGKSTKDIVDFRLQDMLKKMVSK